MVAVVLIKQNKQKFIRKNEDTEFKMHSLS